MAMRVRIAASFLLVAASAVLVAYAAPEPSLESAEAAIEDGFYEVAEKQIEAYLRTVDRYSPEGGDAIALLARALDGLGRHREILILIGDNLAPWKGGRSGALAFWRAMARFQLGEYDKALADLRDFSSAYPSNPYVPRAGRLEAWCDLKSGRTNEAFAAFARFDERYGATAEGLANRLDWGQALVAAGDDGRAEAIFQKLAAEAPAAAEGHEAKLWLAGVFSRTGKWEKAWNLLDVVTGDTAVRADRRTRAWIAIGELNAAQTNYEAAASAAAKGVDIAPTPQLKNHALAVEGRWLIRLGRLDQGAALLRSAIAAAPGESVSAELQLELAGEYLDRSQFDKAAEEYQNYVESFTNTTGLVRALKGRGWALWGLKRYAESATMFEKAYALATDPAGREQCLFKAADATFANGQYKLAGETYDRVLAEFPSTALTPQVMYQAAESLARQSAWDKAESRFRSVVRRYPENPLAERALMRIAEMKEEQGPAHMRAALAAYREVMDVYTNGALYADALHRHGLAAYRLLQFEEALNDFTRVVNEFPKSGAAPQATYMRGWSLYMMGREEEALAVCRAFVVRYPDTEWTPRVVFWIGEFAANHGQYAEAEKQFVSLAESHPKDPLADLALLRAGRAAMKQKEYVRALDLFNKAATQFPASSRLAEIRFQQGDALSELGEFSRAILVFEELIAKFSESDLVAAAWGRKGDCQFTLGASDAKRYDEAMASYGMVGSARGSSLELKLQAEYKIGRCMEKQGRKAEALEQYYTKAVCGYLDEAAASRRASAGAAVWFTKAAFASADILEADKNWRRAVRILERVANAGVPESRAAKDRMERIRTEHWIW